MIVNSIQELLDDIKQIILNIDTNITPDKIINTGWTIEQMSNIPKNQLPLYYIYFNYKEEKPLFSNVRYIFGDLFIGNIYIVDNANNFKTVYDLMVNEKMMNIYSGVLDYIKEKGYLYSKIEKDINIKKQPLVIDYFKLLNIRLPQYIWWRKNTTNRR